MPIIAKREGVKTVKKRICIRIGSIYLIFTGINLCLISLDMAYSAFFWIRRAGDVNLWDGGAHIGIEIHPILYYACLLCIPLLIIVYFVDGFLLIKYRKDTYRWKKIMFLGMIAEAANFLFVILGAVVNVDVNYNIRTAVGMGLVVLCGYMYKYCTVNHSQS